MWGLIAMIVVVLGGLWFLATTEEHPDPESRYQCDVDGLLCESMSRIKPNHHRYSIGLVYKKP